jgi:hypothetical protein
MQESLRTRNWDRKERNLTMGEETTTNRHTRKSLALKENVSAAKKQAILRETT